MQLDAREHFKEIVNPAIADYEQAEAELTGAVQTEDDGLTQAARFKALRLGGAAVIFLHHFADIVAKRPPPGLPDFEGQVSRVRKLLQANGANDIMLLGDAADALKHAILTQRLPREVEEAGQVVAVGRSYGTERYGEGKFGGVDQVWLLARSGGRPLTLVLREVSSVWEMLLFS